MAVVLAVTSSLYDTYHALNYPDQVLREINRILKPEGILSFSDHHMADKAIKEKITKDNLFKLLKKNNKTYTFSKYILRNGAA